MEEGLNVTFFEQADNTREQYSITAIKEVKDRVLFFINSIKRDVMWLAVIFANHYFLTGTRGFGLNKIKTMGSMKKTTWLARPNYDT